MDFALTLASTDDNPIVGDLDIQNNSLYLVDGEDAIIQDVFVCLQWFLGEWFLDGTTGVPYYKWVFVKNPDQRRVVSILTQVILGRPGIAAMTSFALNYDPKTRTISPRFTGKFTSGTSFDSADYVPLLVIG